MGGETGYIDMHDVYQRMPQELRSRLDSAVVFGGAENVSRLATIHSVTEETVLRMCEKKGLPVRDYRGEKYVVNLKPCIYAHGSRKAWLGNLGMELPELTSALNRELNEKLYSGRRWFLHRLAWKSDTVGMKLRFLENLLFPREKRWVYCHQYFTSLKTRLAKRFNRSPSLPPEQHELPAPLMNELIDAGFIHELSKLMSQALVLIKWEPGDLVIFDNTRMMHDGMPGFGPRHMHVMMGNMFIPIADGDGPSAVDDAPAGDIIDTLRHLQEIEKLT